jgi:ligand-binding sensor domain-containing protein
MQVLKITGLLLFALAPLISAQGIHDWQVITYMNDVTGLAVLSNEVWVGTTGGVYRYDATENTVDRFTNLDGLASLKISTVTSDMKYGRILAGSSDGIIHVCPVTGDTWQPYYELQGQRIAGLFCLDDTLWVATDNGVGVFLLTDKSLEFRDFFANLPIIPGSGAAVSVFRNRVYYATASGLLSAPSDFIRHNLKIAEAWKLLTVSDGLPADDVRALATSPDSLYIGTTGGPSWVDAAFNIHPVDGWTSGAVYTIARSAAAVCFANDRSVYRKSGSSWIYQTTSSGFITAMSIDKDNDVWYGIREGGMQKDSWEKPLRLEGPGSNHVGNLIRDSRGRLWMASGKIKLTFDKGYYRLENGRWTNFYFTSSWYRKNSTDVVYEDMFGNIWIGAWGGGITMMRPDDTFDFYHAWPEEGSLIVSDVDGNDTLNFQGLPEDRLGCFVGANVSGTETYTVITQFGEDHNQNFWVVNYLARIPQYLAFINNRSAAGLSDCADWTYYGSNIGLSQSESQISSIVFEDFGEFERIWLGTFGQGVIVYDNPPTNYIFKLSMTTDNLFSNTILCMARDLDGIIWIGTDAGLNSYQPDASGTSRLVYKHVGETGPVENKINQIFVDDNNNKWFATDGGLSVLIADRSPWDASSWVHYTPQNSGLPDKIVNSVFVDARTGAAYIGTESGLAIFNGAFSGYKSDMNELATGPNPFITDGSNSFIIKNLAFNSRVKIFNLKGELIRELTTDKGEVQGSRAVWDGKDSKQNAVASGIYLFLAFNDEGMNGSGKIAVIHR